MPIKLEDAAEHIRGIRGTRNSFTALIDTIKSMVAGIQGAADRDDVVRQLDDHRDSLLDAVHASGPGSPGTLGPGETPARPGDPERMTARQAEDLNNPLLPRDMAGNKMHPSDALSLNASTDARPVGGDTSRTDEQRRAEGFGGDGGRSADDASNLKSISTTKEVVTKENGDVVEQEKDASGVVLNETMIRAADPKNGPSSV